jgi:hypothetical protein
MFAFGAMEISQATYPPRHLQASGLQLHQTRQDGTAANDRGQLVPIIELSISKVILGPYRLCHDADMIERS